MWQTLRKRFPTDRDLPERTAIIQARQRVLAGTIYDDLPHGFHEEQNGAGEYVPLRNRRPSVQQNLSRLVVGQASAMLFSEGHFPEFLHDDQDTRDALNEIARDIRLNATMIDATHKGSVGSVCLWMRVLKGRLFVSALTTEYLTPTFDPQQPDRLIRVRERYKVRGKDLAAMGYPIPVDAAQAQFWFTRDWDDQAETWYQPVRVDKDDQENPKLKPDPQRSVTHALGFVPMRWIKNLPGGDEIDGAPTFDDAAVQTNIEMDYLLSQGGRGLKYSADPLLLIKEPASDPGGQMVRSASNAIIVGPDGDAKLVEIDGSASAAVLEYARALRELVIEELSGNRANPDKLAAAQSGRALELLNQALVWLADQLRISYGEDGLKGLMQMIVAVSQKMQLIDSEGKPIPKLKPGRVRLKWPDWYAPTASDKQADANTLRTLTDAGLMSRETALGVLAATYDIEDQAAELARIQTEAAERNAAAQVNATIQE